MRHLLILFVRAYQVALSPLFTGCCRFEPSCSNYAIEALRVHGALKGMVLAAARLIRCRPFGPHGYDPVPLKGQRLTFGLLVKGVEAGGCKSATPYQGTGGGVSSPSFRHKIHLLIHDK